ncbi:hypothetical protein KXD40_007858 [Peronospora effusa]|uniref:Uncharacterized protein n=1 Tax=Peronospora effusa TaxID=542832 RepID=A0A3M6VRX3_9STRA|nr:hypothetical protein DD238_002812 [Peronospora effusa]RQM12088.1 hypothetical protein DD237_007363 [Peronospora effusa]UIZ23629.1 hypothetical protein KXD40_007858 [Peronospora effusa]
MEEVSFKKKKKRGTAKRQRSRRFLDDETDVTAFDDNDTVDVEQIQRNIKELREDQRLREQALKKELTNQKAEVSQPTNQYGLHDPKKDGSTNQKLLTLLDGQFTGQSVTTDKDQHEELMNKFIEERLQKKRKLKTLEEENNVENVAQALKNAEDKLFELPDHLKPDVSSGIKSYEDGTDGGMLMGSAGIAEVELPTSYTEKTEKATRKALETGKVGGVNSDAVGGLASSGLPANFSVDFNRHRTDYVAEMKSLNKDERRERGFHQVGKNQASDDRVVSRFRKFESRQMRR